eukprot:1124733-Alexandrium_andersonii.AAC.1
MHMCAPRSAKSVPSSARRRPEVPRSARKSRRFRAVPEAAPRCILHQVRCACGSSRRGAEAF